MKVFNSEQSKEYVAFTMFFIYLFFFYAFINLEHHIQSSIKYIHESNF